jgi:peroxiredoxin
MTAIINTDVKPFKATAYHNGKFVPVSDSDLKGKWSVVFFYPADFTFVCPTELGDMADHYAELKKMGVEVYSVSTDTHFTHKAWHDASDTIKKIQFPMIGDPTGVISRNFGVMIEEEGWHCVAPSSSIRRARSRSLKSTTWVSAAQPRSYSARFRLPNMSLLTMVKCARLPGPRGKRRWRRRWIWSEKSEAPGSVFLSSTAI